MAILRDVVSNDNGQEVQVYIEIDEVDERIVDSYEDTRGPGIRAIDAREAMGKAMDLVKTCAEQVADTVQKISEKVRPSGCEVQFAIKFDTEVGAMIAKVSSEAQLQVTLKWEKQE